MRVSILCRKLETRKWPHAARRGQDSEESSTGIKETSRCRVRSSARPKNLAPSRRRRWKWHPTSWSRHVGVSSLMTSMMSAPFGSCTLWVRRFFVGKRGKKEEKKRDLGTYIEISHSLWSNASEPDRFQVESHQPALVPSPDSKIGNLTNGFQDANLIDIDDVTYHAPYPLCQPPPSSRSRLWTLLEYGSGRYVHDARVCALLLFRHLFWTHHSGYILVAQGLYM